jgi:AGZA family xanthine/uracil permease-like MFS transporter
MVLAALLVQVIDRNFKMAVVWAAVAMVMSMTGLIHAYELTSSGVQNIFGIAAAPDFAVIYGLGAVMLLVMHGMQRTGENQQSE